MQVDNDRFPRLASSPRHDAVALSVTWRWSSETKRYWLDVKTWDESTEEVLTHSSNNFSWKDVDAVGDAALATRWIRQARKFLAQ